MHFAATASLGDLPASLRYFYGQGSSLGGFAYPVFASASATPVEVAVEFAPLRPCDPSRNAVTLLTKANIPSNFLTVGGTPISLAIIPNQSQITQQWDPLQRALYPVPVGNWQLATASTGPSGPPGGSATST